MREIERALRQRQRAKEHSKQALQRLKDIEHDISLPALNYDRIGSSSKGFSSSPVEKQAIRIEDAQRECVRGICREIDATAAVIDLLALMDDEDEMNLLLDLFLYDKSMQSIADHLRIKYKTLLSRKAAALDHLDELIQNNERAAGLFDTLKHIADAPNE